MTWLTLLFACATNVTVPDTQTALYDGPPQTVPTVGTATPTGSGTTTTGGTTVTTGGSIGLPFAVDNHFAPSGYMGDGITGGLVDSPDCDQRAGEAWGSCHRVAWTPGSKGWAGIYWQYPENNWGEEAGMPIQEGATRVRLWAWSEVDGVNLEVFVGGMGGTFADTFNANANASLSSTPTEISIDLSSATYTSVIGGFGFSLGGASSEDTVVVYIDDIAWE